MRNATRESFGRDGFALIEKIIAPEKCDAIAGELDQLWKGRSVNSGLPVGGLRNLMQASQAVREIAHSADVNAVLRAIFPGGAFPVRSIYFDKTPDTNWSVAWHQDLHIAVAQKIETPGFGPWSVKAGIVHVQPPPEILSQMVTVRLHLDDCDESNGALKVIPGSHAHGILSDADLVEWRKREAATCSMCRGGVLLMRPLLLHSSSSAMKPSHRRVLHLEYACEALPNGLRWNEQS